MNEYDVTIEELISGTFKVKANSPEEARELAEEKYWDCEFVLGPNVTCRKMQVAGGSWSEF